VARLVDALVLEVRDVVDENNTADLTDEELLRFLNRAQKKLARLIARHAPDLFKREVTLASLGSAGVKVPDLSLGFTVTDVATQSGSTWYPATRRSLKEMTEWDAGQSGNLPLWYSCFGRSLKFYPTSTAGTIHRVRYQYRPPDLVKSLGRVTAFAEAGAGGSTVTVTLDAVSSTLSTNIDNLEAFVNIVDGLTGEIRATLQISNINTSEKRLTFKSSSLDRTVVHGLDVSSALPSGIAKDDYICKAEGVCIPLLFQDYDDYLVAHAATEVKKKLGESVQEDQANLSGLEEDLRLAWSGREAHKRVTRHSKFWS
jgi:hypothetical protein